MKKYYYWAFFPISIFYCELWLRLFSGERFFNWGLLTVALFSVFFGLLSQFVSFNKNGGLIAVQSVLSLWYSVQTVYHNIFGTYMILYSLKGADQIAESEMLGEAFLAIMKSLWQVLILFVPLVLLIIGIKKFKNRPEARKHELLTAAGVTAAVLAVTMIIRFAIPYYRDRNAIFEMNRSVSYNGLLYTEILDFGYNILGIDNGYEIDPDVENEILSSGEEDPKYKPNVMEIDFETLASQETDATVKALHEYFAGRTPTNQNEYTGMFKGYNLIQVTAEGFSYFAIDKELTPTLYKMQHEGFDFTNFYTPIWGVSTSDGEYVATTGLIPKGGIWSYFTSGKNNIFFPFTMPQQYLNDGLKTVRAYHNHTYTYYSRHISHKNMGFIYKGIGNGLEKVVNPKRWPESDHEMLKGTTGEYIGKDRFMTYYMTVSGHLNYTFMGNSMAARHKDKVKHLDLSSNAKAYLACNIELDLAMQHLLTALEEAGVAEKTVIVITPDHYPYGLEDKEHIDTYHYFSELAGHEIDLDFELYKSCLIIYSPGMEKPITVDKYCSSLDIIPTLNNLFGFEYDSRLLPGSDIMSDSQPLIVFNNHSFITEKGSYNSKTDEFILFEGQELEDEDEYVASMRKVVNNKFKISAQILKTNYYSKVINREHKYSQK
ncbi:MAG: LTA synthase family protein [Ruminococcaceae bacterium]|nr:LTA synthase family protein [Oscillospiraceae bacterium]